MAQHSNYSMSSNKLYRIVHILLFLVLLFGGLYYAKLFLMPAVFGVLFSMLLLPKVKWLEGKGVPSPLAILICIFVVFIIFSGIFTLIGWQLTGLSDEISQVSKAFDNAMRHLKDFIRETIGLSRRETDKLVEGPQNQTSENAPKIVAGILGVLSNMVTNIVLIIVYTFLFLYMRSHFKKFVLKVVKEENKEKTTKIMKDSIVVAHGYISGMVKMIASIIILYMIGLSITGVKHPILFATLTGTLEIIPFVGNLTGATLTVIMALVQDDTSLAMVLGVISVFILVQFIQAYLLEPMIVGSEINLNPFFTIIALVLGQIVWGISGMILALPMLGIIKILCDNIEPLKPYGFLFGEEKPKKKEPGFIEKLKRKFSKS